MPPPSEESARSLGLRVARAWTPEAFQAVIGELVVLTPESGANGLAIEYERLGTVANRKPLLVGQMRNHMISAGSMSLLLSFREQSDDVPAQAALLKSYLGGIKAGKYSRWEARAEVASRLSLTIAECLSSSSYAAFDAAASYREVGREAGLLGGRQRVEVALAFAGHRWRHRASRKAIKLALDEARETESGAIIVPNTTQ